MATAVRPDTREWKELEATLHALRSHLRGDRDELEDEVEGPPDRPIEGGDRSLFDQLLATEGELLEGNAAVQQEVDDALGRMRDGTYGICDDCERPIPYERLQQVPWTRWCIEDARAHERRGR